VVRTILFQYYQTTSGHLGIEGSQPLKSIREKGLEYVSLERELRKRNEIKNA